MSRGGWGVMALRLTDGTRRPHMVRRPFGHSLRVQLETPPKRQRHAEAEALGYLRDRHALRRKYDYASTLAAAGADRADLSTARWAELVVLVAEGRS